jgi:hypothetical protein
MATVIGDGTKERPWQLKTPPGISDYQSDEPADPRGIVCQVGGTQLRYQLRAIDDLHSMLKGKGRLGGAGRYRRAEARA